MTVGLGYNGTTIRGVSKVHQAPVFQPAWLTFEIQQALSELPSRLHRDTVLRLAESAVVGRSERDTFKLPDVCSRRTWYGRYRDGEKRPGWRDDPKVQRALHLATNRAQWWTDNEAAREIERAQSKLARYSPIAVDVLGVLMQQAESEETRRKSANDILDRASLDTASKSRGEVSIREVVIGLSDDAAVVED